MRGSRLRWFLAAAVILAGAGCSKRRPAPAKAAARLRCFPTHLPTHNFSPESKCLSRPDGAIAPLAVSAEQNVNWAACF